jgi:hypothetical protein
VATVGDDLPVPVADRPEFRAALAGRDGRRTLALMVDYGTALLERAGPLIITTIESAGADPDMRRIADEGARATVANLGAFVHALADHGALRPGLDTQRATDVLVVLSSPHVHHLFRHERGWTAERYRDCCSTPSLARCSQTNRNTPVRPENGQRLLRMAAAKSWRDPEPRAGRYPGPGRLWCPLVALASVPEPSAPTDATLLRASRMRLVTSST